MEEPSDESIRPDEPSDSQEYFPRIARRNFLGLAISASLLSGHEAFAEGSTDAVPRRALGKTGEKVSIIGLGGFHIGNPWDEREAIKIMHAAIDGGINFFDNCWDYHGGASEARMGKALTGGYRDKVFLMTKIDGRDNKTAAKQIDESLKRLQTDRIDLMQIHEVIRTSDPNRCFEKGGAMEALIEAKKQGKIRFIGFTGHKSPVMHLQMINTAIKHDFTFDTVQLPLNVMDAHYDSFETSVLPVLNKRNIGVLAMKPMGGGIILESHTVSPVECLQYALSLPVSVVITGCDTMELVNQALHTARGFQPLKSHEMAALREKTKAVAVAGKFERYKTDDCFDGTEHHPEWMG